MAINDDMGDSIVYEIHPAGTAMEAKLDGSVLPWNEKEKTAPPPIAVRPRDGTVWVGRDSESGALRTVKRKNALAGFRFVRRKLNTALAMVTERDGVLVNGRPVLPLTALAVKDSLVLAPGLHASVTERVTPHVGSPPRSLLGKVCPFCRIPLTEETRVVMCRCGTAYHLESKQEGPEQRPEESENKPDDDGEPLRCFEKVRQCLSCSRPLTREEYLQWDPENL